MKVYITKYCLTHGIIEANAVQDRTEPTTIHVNHGHGLREFRGDDWHARRKDAVRRAVDVRDLRIMSLSRQANRINNIKF